MDSKLLKISMALCLCSCMSACDDGEYNNLDCDPNVYESECLSNNSYMYCRDGILTVVECGTKSVCQSKKKTHQDGTEEIVVSCEPLNQKPQVECTTNADCKDATKPVCSAQGVCVAAEQKPECTTNDDCKDASKPVCSAQGVCVADETPTDTVDPCKDVTCTEGTCDRGVCVTDAMKNVKEGDECDGSFVDFCLGDSMVFCSRAVPKMAAVPWSKKPSAARNTSCRGAMDRAISAPKMGRRSGIVPITVVSFRMKVTISASKIPKVNIRRPIVRSTANSRFVALNATLRKPIVPTKFAPVQKKPRQRFAISTMKATASSRADRA